MAVAEEALGVARFCVWGGYGQGSEFSIVSLELYQHLKRNTAGFEERAAFQAGSTYLGVQRPGSANPAESYQGESVSGNYFATFGVGADRQRRLAGGGPGGGDEL